MQLLVPLTHTSPETVNISEGNNSLISNGDETTVVSDRLSVFSSDYLASEIADIGLHLEAIVILSLFVSSVVLNCLMFLFFFRKSSLLTLSNRFVLNFGLCNILSTVSTMPAIFVSLITRQWVMSAPWCQATGFLTSVSFTCNSLTLIVVSIDRFCAVISPLRYKTLVTPTRSWFVLVLVWTISLATSLPPFFGWNRYEYQSDKFTCAVTWKSHQSLDQYYTLFIFLFDYVIPLVIILLTYAIMFRAAMHNSARTCRLNVRPVQIPEETVYKPIYKKSITDSRASLLSIKQWQAEKSPRSIPSQFRRDLFTTARTSFIVIFSFIICWTPFYLCTLLESFLSEEKKMPVFISHMSFCLTLCNPIVTPMVYVFRNRVVRRELERTFFPKTRTPPNLTSLYGRQIVNTKVVSRGNYVENMIDSESSSDSFVFTNDGFEVSKWNVV